MSRMIILTEADLRKIVRLDAEAVTCVENAFRALATLPVAMPSRLSSGSPMSPISCASSRRRRAGGAMPRSPTGSR